MTTSPATVAVVVAAFDPGDHLRPALDSLLAQTLDTWECVVVDDGSHEDLRWVDKVDPRIALVRQANGGVHAARNTGAAETTAPLLTFLDQDDLWQPTYLAKQVAQFVDPSVVLASTGFDIVDESGQFLEAGFVGHNRSYLELLTGCGLHCGTVMVRRSAFAAVAGFRAYPIAQDWDLWLRILRAGGAVARTDETLGSWRRHGRNASADYRGLWHDGRTLLAEHPHPAARTGRRRVRELSGVQAFDAARASRGSPTVAARHLVWAMIHAPGYTVRSLAGRPFTG